MNAEEENQVSVRLTDESVNPASARDKPDQTDIKEEEEQEGGKGNQEPTLPPPAPPAEATQGNRPLKTRLVSKKVEVRKKRAASEALDQTDDDTAGDPGQRGGNEKLTQPKKRTMKTVGAEDAENEENVSFTPAAKKRRKAPKSTTGQKGNWLKQEDNLIIHLKKEGKGWQDITNAVNIASGPGNERTLTAVRLRYQKVLKDRDTELTEEEFLLLKRAETEITNADKYSLIIKRYKELSGKDMTKLACQRFLALAKKGDSSVTKHDEEEQEEEEE